MSYINGAEKICFSKSRAFMRFKPNDCNLTLAWFVTQGPDMPKTLLDDLSINKVV